MKSFSASSVTKATPKQVWKAWTDLPAWPKHDPSLDWLHIDIFAEGARGKIKPKKDPVSNIIIENVINGQAFSIRTPLPLCVMETHHDIKPLANGKTQLEFTIEFSGLLSGFFYMVIGKGIQKSTKSNMKTLGELARTEY